MAIQKKPKADTAETFGLRGVGKQIEKHLARLNIFSVQDVLLHLPARYQDRTQIEMIRQVIPGNEAVVEGVIQSIEKPLRGRTKLLCTLVDATGKMHLRFFHVLRFHEGILKPGTRLRCYAAVRLGPMGLEMTHPEFQVISEGKPVPVDQHLTPIYPATEGLNQYLLRKITSNALTWMAGQKSFDELMPETIIQSHAYPTLKEAIRYVHRPPHDASMADLLDSKTLPQRRLIFEELTAHRLSLLHMKQLFQAQKSLALIKEGTLCQQFLANLPFQLTNAQQRVVAEIKADLSRDFPMLRLVQGDVGSGKTMVALLAMLHAVENSQQAAMMAPTELLAEQHYRVFKRYLEPLGLQVQFLSSNVKGVARRQALQAIQTGEAHIILGTHALFQQEVIFSKLALVVIDEQHRFGVHQRALLREKGMQSDCHPHQLIMTATPIPRTLAMSFYADLDCSIIDELPPGRTPVVTSIVASARREEIVARIRDACGQGRQAYWVCPLIEESESVACQAATTTSEELQLLLPNLKVGLIHGRMKAADKESVMKAFSQGDIHLLVATTVIEVGVDVPNASVMVIENAERLGLSQLHQLRGRVGRGSAASYCVLLYKYLSPLAKERLGVMRETSDGFKIAERDLSLRGPGEVLGTKQTGELVFSVADLIRDSDMLPSIHRAAEVITREHPEVIEPLINRWLGEGKYYGKV